MTKDIGDMGADDWRGLTEYEKRHVGKHIISALDGYRARLAEAERQRDELAKVLGTLMLIDWDNYAAEAGGTPLPDFDDVLNSARAALAAVKGD